MKPLVIASLCIGLVACGGGSDNASTSNSTLSHVSILSEGMRTQSVATAPSVTVARVYQTLNGKAPGNATFTTAITQVGNTNGFDWANQLAATKFGFSDSAFASYVLNNIGITPTSLTPTAAFGTAQQAYEGLQRALSEYLTAFAPKGVGRGTVVLQLANIIAGLEIDTTFGVYGPAAIAFNKQVAANQAYSSIATNLTDALVTTSTGTDTSNGIGAGTTGTECDSKGNIFTVNGNTAQMDTNTYGSDGTTILIRGQNKYLVTTGKSFNTTTGLTELRQTNTSSYTSATANGVSAGTTVGPTELKSYFGYGVFDVTLYGVITTPPPTAGLSIVTTSSFTPPAAWPANPALNTPYTRSVTVTFESTILGQVNSISTTQTETRTFSTESISTFVGTFAACKIKTDITKAGGSPTTSYSWQVGSGRLKGHLLRSANAQGVRTLESTVLLVNGT